MGAIQFDLFAPPPELSRDVECIRLASYHGDAVITVKTCPSGLPGLVFHLSGDGAAIESITTRSAEARHLPFLFLYGQGAEPSIMRFRAGPYATIQVVLKPFGLYSLFGRHAASIDPGFLRADDIGASALQDRLRAAHCEAWVGHLNDYLRAVRANPTPRDELIERCVAHIDGHVESIQLKEVLALSGLSERQFQLRFARVVGLRPLLYLRIKRINAALRMIRSGRYSRFVDLAHDLNYSDQSHFIRDMKAFSWVTPQSIADAVTEFHQDQAGASYL